MIMRSLVSTIAAGVALLIFSRCYAGGESWEFVVTAFTSDYNDKFVVELSPVDKASSFPNSCTTLTVAGEYASSFWFLKFGGGPGRREHMAALELMGDAFKSKMPIKFGWIGDGVNVSRRTGACTAISRGLMADAASDAVYSYFKWP
jgi:hypothetical protein